MHPKLLRIYYLIPAQDNPCHSCTPFALYTTGRDVVQYKFLLYIHLIHSLHSFISLRLAWLAQRCLPLDMSARPYN